MKKVSETERGANFLKNFDTEEDRATARILIDSLLIEDAESVKGGLLGALADYKENNVASRVDGQANVRAYVTAMRSLEDFPREGRYSSLIKGSDISSRVVKRRRGTKSLSGRDKWMIAFSNIDPGANFKTSMGSEGEVANAIRSACENDSFWIPDDSIEIPDIEFHGSYSSQRENPYDSLLIRPFRDKRVNRIVIVTDFVGSGRQALNHTLLFLRNKYIRNWRAGGKLKVAVVCHATTRRGEEFITSSGYVDEFIFNIYAPSIYDDRFNTKLRSQIIELCKKYAGTSRDKLGYKNSGGLYIGLSKIPNNIPKVLRRNDANWKYPLFYNREHTTQAKGRLGPVLPLQPYDYLALASERPEWYTEIGIHVHPSLRGMLENPWKVLNIIHDRGGTLESVMEISQLASGDFQDSIDFLSEMKLISVLQSGRLVQSIAGRSAVSDARQRATREKHEKLVDTRRQLYYPGSLR
ncbi:phosphoribosyltransferase-like protein [Micrococcus luteus]|uniref:phosphoribosyltransferase-like protein n=1 Tax=Micrococcus luteus TaxID=1270 RepID=UPI00117FAC16|nr:hypothetical protein [Micrococcus luteus]